MYFRSSSDILAGRTKSVQIDIAILDKNKYENKIIFNGVIDTYVSDHNFLTFLLNI